MSDCAKKTFHDTIMEHSPHSTCLTAVTPAEDSEEKGLNQNGEKMETTLDKEDASDP